jgi:hypothetical protein
VNNSDFGHISRDVLPRLHLMSFLDLGYLKEKYTVCYKPTRSNDVRYGSNFFSFCFADSCFNMQVDPTAAGVLYDREFVVCSLDLLSGLAEGLGAGIESLVISFLWP